MGAVRTNGFAPPHALWTLREVLPTRKTEPCRKQVNPYR